MKTIKLSILWILGALGSLGSVHAQEKPIAGGVYDCADNVKKSYTLFSGSADVLSKFDLSLKAITSGSKKITVKVKGQEEQLLLVRKGTISIGVNGSVSSVGKGSLALMVPGTTYTLQNTGADEAQYHLMSYAVKSKRGKDGTKSFVMDWNDVQFKGHDHGGVRSFFKQPTALTSRLDVHVTTLNAGLSSHPPHTHKAEEIILMLDGKGEMSIGGKDYVGNAGDAFFCPTQVPHGIKNIDSEHPTSYFAIQWD